MKTTPLLLLLTLAAGLVGCEKRQAAAPMPPVKVSVASPQNITVTNWDEYPGHVTAIEEVEVRARVSGYLESIHFVEGAEVKAGDLLFVIDPKPYQAELEHATAMKRQAETHLELAQNDLKRAEMLRGTKAISEEELDSRTKAVREAEDALKAAQAAEQTSKLNLDYTRVTAPISGRVGRRLVTVGNLVQANGTPVLATLVSVAPIYCYFDVQEEVFAQYRQCFQTEAGGKQTIAMPCELKLGNEQGYPRRGQVDFFDNRVDAKTGTIRLRAVFANDDRSLVPGMFATVRVPAGPATEALTIPDLAILADQNYKFVYVVNEKSEAEMRTVKIGRAHGPLRAVLDGLTPQDRVVTNGLVMLRRGSKVDLQSGPRPVAGPRETKGQEPPATGTPKTQPEKKAEARNSRVGFAAYCPLLAGAQSTIAATPGDL